MPYRISVLGTSGLRGDEGQPVNSVLQQPRRFALLVYLALESRSGPVRRDTVLGVFWPDKTWDIARGSLNQALYYLRRSLGPDAIRTYADSVEVDGGIVTCDAVELLVASEEGRWLEAADLHGGELLPGYFDNGQSAEFEHWLEATRATIQAAAAKCAWRMAEVEEGGGNAPGAIVWARQACALSSGREAQVRSLMEMMARLGDRAGVLEAFGTLCRSLGELDATPAPATKELLARLRASWEEEDRKASPAGNGSREVRIPWTAEPQAKEDQGIGVTDPAPELAGAPTLGPPGSAPPRDPRRGSWPRPLRKLVSAAVTSGLMILILSLWAVTRVPTSVASTRTTVVIEGMEALEADAAVARMLHGGVVSQLQEMTALRVVAEADREAVARERGFVLRGNLLRMGEELQASVHLLDGESGTTLASTRLERPTAELPGGLDEMARAVAQFARREVGAALAARRLVEAPFPERAITMVQLGRQDMALGASLWRDRSTEGAMAAYLKADSMFAEATRLAPQWDLPWIDRAETAYRLMWIQRRSEAGSREAERDLVARGIRFAGEAIARNGRQAESLELRALLYEWQGLLAQPDASGGSAELLARAEGDARRATELDPHRARAWNVLGATLLYRGMWVDAYWALGRAVAADTHLKNDAEILFRLFTAAWETGNDEGARAWCDLLAERIGQGWPTANCRMHLMAGATVPDLGRLAAMRSQAETWPYWSSVAHQFDAVSAVLHARAGEEVPAREILAGSPSASAGSELPYFVAWALLELGDVELARATLEAHVATAPATLAFLFESRRFRKLAGPR